MLRSSITRLFTPSLHKTHHTHSLSPLSPSACMPIANDYELHNYYAFIFTRRSLCTYSGEAGAGIGVRSMQDIWIPGWGLNSKFGPRDRVPPIPVREQSLSESCSCSIREQRNGSGRKGFQDSVNAITVFAVYCTKEKVHSSLRLRLGSGPYHFHTNGRLCEDIGGAYLNDRFTPTPCLENPKLRLLISCFVTFYHW
jgi:hypothetical protein